MDFPTNHLKRNLRAGKVQTGCWLSLASHTSAEICASAGFDWVLIDMEHAPDDLPQVHQQLHAAAAYPTSVLVRAPWNDTVLIKRLLDVGVQSLAAALRPERGGGAPRGGGGALPAARGARACRPARAPTGSDGSRTTSPARTTRPACCCRSRRARRSAEIEKMAAIDGVDGLFIGPQDLAADLGHLGNPGHPEVQAAIGEAIARIKRDGQGAGLAEFQRSRGQAVDRAGCAVRRGDQRSVPAGARDARRWPRASRLVGGAASGWRASA